MIFSRIRIGMLGGGQGAGIAQSHRRALRLDDRYELLSGVFSRDAKRSQHMGAELHLDPERVYHDYQEMAFKEANRADGIEVVSIVTPNDSHYAIAKTFLEQGIHVICDKPLTDNLAEAIALHELAQRKGLILALTHNYSAYAMVREAALQIRKGTLGKLRLVQAEHASGWAASALEKGDHKQAAWRTDPNQAGQYSVLLDLGTHLHHLTRYVTGLEVESLTATLGTAVEDRQVFDDAELFVRLEQNVRGAFWISMAATGTEHGLRLRVYGDKASLEWRHETPHYLTIYHLNGRREILSQGQSDLSQESQRLTRVGLGHPEGFLEAFANLYTDVADALIAKRENREDTGKPLAFPSSVDGIKGLRFVEAIKNSYQQQSAWVRVETSEKEVKRTTLASS